MSSLETTNNKTNIMPAVGHIRGIVIEFLKTAGNIS